MPLSAKCVSALYCLTPLLKLFLRTRNGVRCSVGRREREKHARVVEHANDLARNGCYHSELRAAEPEDRGENEDPKLADAHALEPTTLGVAG
jgi:hypothetical protein